MVSLHGHVAGNGGHSQGDTYGRGWSSPTRRRQRRRDYSPVTLAPESPGRGHSPLPRPVGSNAALLRPSASPVAQRLQRPILSNTAASVGH